MYNPLKLVLNFLGSVLEAGSGYGDTQSLDCEIEICLSREAIGQGRPATLSQDGSSIKRDSLETEWFWSIWPKWLGIFLLLILISGDNSLSLKDYMFLFKKSDGMKLS